MIYYSVKDKAEGLFKDKGSKFLGYVFPVSTEDQCKLFIIDYKRTFHDARHHCYAYTLGSLAQKSKYSDDGEPSSSAGKPILNQLVTHSLSNTMIIVVRYFGGTLLGVNGLINAYKNAAADAIKNAELLPITEKVKLTIAFNYEQMNMAMKIIKETVVKIENTNINQKCEILAEINKEDLVAFKEKFKLIQGIDIQEINLH